MHLDGLIAADPDLHPPGQVRQSAEGLPVDEVGPAADALARQQSQHRQVRHGPEFQLLVPGVEEGHQHTGDDRAVDGKPAVPNGNHLAPVEAAVGVAVQVQVEDHVVQPGADDAAGHRPEHHVQHIVLREPVTLGLLHAQQQSRQHGDGQNDAVPVDPVADVDGDGVRIELPIPKEAREADGHVR